MKKLHPIQIFGTFLLLFFSVSGFSNSINGTWVNIDPDTRGLTKAVISENSKLRLWAACNQTECHIGETKIWDGGSYFKALIHQQIAMRKMKISATDQSNLRIIVRTEYKDDRPNRLDYFYFKKIFSLEKEDGGSIIIYNKMGKENCIKIDYATAKVNTNGKNFELVSGAENPTSFFGFGNQKRKAISALNVIKSYEVSQSCTIGSMQYLLTNDGAPRKDLEGQDCIPFELNKLKIKRLNGKYKITSDNVAILDLGKNQADAKTALKMLKKYGFKNLCYVSRNEPVFMYFKR